MGIVDPQKLLESLVAEPRETEWLEFKKNNFDENDVGKYVSGLANSAMLHDQPYGYLIFGVEDGTHKVVGTSLRLKDKAIRACDQHAAVRWEAGMTMTNQSLRNRFGLGEKQYPQVSVVIRDAIEAGLIRPQEEGQANRNASYVPAWA